MFTAQREHSSAELGLMLDWQGSPDENGYSAVGTLGAIMGLGEVQLHCTLEKERIEEKKNSSDFFTMDA